MITFVYGAPGSGKTHYVFDQLKENSSDCFLIVPEQQTVITERHSLELLPYSAQLDFEVLNFSRLCNRVFRELGGLSYNYINPTVKKLFMWRTLRELAPTLSEYNAPGSDIAMTETMQKTVDELRSCSITPNQLENAAKNLPDGSLRSKLMDISLINAAYTALIKENYDDKSEDMAKLCELLSKNSFFKGKRVFIDSFTSFTSPEYAVIEHIFRQADDVVITLGCESPDCGLMCCESICKSAKKLEALAKEVQKKSERIYLTGNFRAKNQELASIVTDLWRSGASLKTEIPDENRGNMRLFVCRDSYEEAEAAVSLVKSEIMHGLRYRDIAIIARDASKYSGIIDAALENAGIPFFMSEKTDISSSSAILLLLCALKMKAFGIKSEDVISMLKTGLFDCTQRESDMFENYVYTWSISGNAFLNEHWTMNPDGYTSKMSARSEQILESANKVRSTLIGSLTALFEDLDRAESTREMCVALYNYVSALQLERKLRTLAFEALERGCKRESADIKSTLGIIYNILDDIVSAFSDEKLSDEEFYRAFKLCCTNAASASIPTGYDEVTVGSVSMLRTDNIKCAIVIGLNEGDFPAMIKDNGVLTDSDRHSLSSLGISLTSDSAERSAEELLYARRALTLPSERLYLLYSAATAEGKAMRPSIIINRLTSFLPYIKPETFGKADPMDAIYTVNSAKERLPFIRNVSDGKVVRSVLDELGEDSGSMRIKLDNYSIPEVLARDCFGNIRELTKSSIESFANCPLIYYFNYVLKLRDEKKAEIDAMVSGSFVHSVLENFLKKSLDENGISSASSEDLVDEVINSIIDSICTSEQKDSNRLNHLFLRLRRISLLMIRSLTKEFEKSMFRPAYYELRIGLGSDIPPLQVKLDDGSSVLLGGVVDRVDLWKDKDKIYIRVVDYKTGTRKFTTDNIQDGLNLQLLIYLFALCKNGQSIAQENGGECLSPASASYFSSGMSAINYESVRSEDKVIEDALKKLNRSGFSFEDDDVRQALNDMDNAEILAVSAKGLEELEHQLTDTVSSIAKKIRSGHIAPEPHIDAKGSACNYCKFSDICRHPIKTNNF